MKKFLLVSLILLGCKFGYAQFVTCESMPLSYNEAGITFKTSTFTADSAINIDITNLSGTNFAYPLAKLVPLTVYPTGMTVAAGSDDWTVFASAWNHNDTAEVEFYYYVTQPIPVNYTMDFLLYVSNFLPLSTDSCVFTDTVKINLNPTGIAGLENETEQTFHIYPNPANDFIYIQFETGMNERWIDIYSLSGQLLRSVLVNDPQRIDLSSFENGMHIVKERGSSFGRKLVINN